MDEEGVRGYAQLLCESMGVLESPSASKKGFYTTNLPIKISFRGLVIAA